MFKFLISDVFCRGRGLVVVLSLIAVFLGSVGLDQASKAHMHRDLLEWEDPEDTDRYLGRKRSLVTLGNRFSNQQGEAGPYIGMGWQYSRNKGAAFSMFSGIDDKYRVPMFYAITFIAVILIYFYLKSTPFDHYLTRYGLVLVLSGAIGNFLDRLHRGYVVDFIDVDWRIFGWQHDFAIFNVADVAINIGVICLLLDMAVQGVRSKRLAAKQ